VLIIIFPIVPPLEASFCDLPTWRHQFAIGPEIYHLKRIRKGGTSQDGTLYGGRATYEHIGRYLVYWAVDTAYAIGTLDGHSGNGSKLRSRFSDFWVEGRFGYTFQSKSASCAQFTPFVGWGYFIEKNNYIHPSPLRFHFKNTFNYAAFGALTKAYIRTYLTIGLNVTGRISLDGRMKVTHDPDFDDSTLRYENKIHCRASIPLSYLVCIGGCPAEFRLAPFYEYREYGKHHNVPFDFPDTRIKIFGVDFQYILLY
jgi:hypothetical protein